MTEIWKPIPSLDGYYEASNLGRIRRAKPGRRTKVGNLVRPQVRGNSTPYFFFVASTGAHATRRSIGVAHAVLDAFVGPRPEGHEPEHIDQDSLNNRLENLMWLPAHKNRPGRPKATPAGQGRWGVGAIKTKRREIESRMP